jgi:hypothetical protein
MSRASVGTIRARERQDRARRLKVVGLTYQQIADSLDDEGRRLYASAGSARRAVLASQERGGGEVRAAEVTTGERRALADDRYERLIQTWMPKALSGDDRAADIIGKYLVAQAALHGTNLRPAAVTPDSGAGEGDHVDDIRRKREERHAARAAAAADPSSSA